MGHVEARQLRPAHPAGIAHQQEGPVPPIDQPVLELVERGGDLLCGHPLLLMARGHREGSAHPRIVSRTKALEPGLGWRAREWICPMAAKRRVMVDTAAGSRSWSGKASSLTYPATVPAVAGRASSPATWHQAAKSAQSDA